MPRPFAKRFGEELALDEIVNRMLAAKAEGENGKRLRRLKTTDGWRLHDVITELERGLLWGAAFLSETKLGSLAVLPSDCEGAEKRIIAAQRKFERAVQRMDKTPSRWSEMLTIRDGELAGGVAARADSLTYGVLARNAFVRQRGRRLMYQLDRESGIFFPYMQDVLSKVFEQNKINTLLPEFAQ